jgi:hypothetical protein
VENKILNVLGLDVGGRILDLYGTDKCNEILCNLLVADVLEDGLLSAGLIPAVRHALQSLCLPDAIVLPSSVAVFAQPLELRWESVRGYDVSACNLWRWEAGHSSGKPLSPFLVSNPAADGSRWTVERVVEMEADADVFSAACGGAHRLYGLATAVDARRRAGLPTSPDGDDGWAAAAVANATSPPSCSAPGPMRGRATPNGRWRCWSASRTNASPAFAIITLG